MRNCYDIQQSLSSVSEILTARKQELLPPISIAQIFNRLRHEFAVNSVYKSTRADYPLGKHRNMNRINYLRYEYYKPADGLRMGNEEGKCLSNASL